MDAVYANWLRLLVGPCRRVIRPPLPTLTLLTLVVDNGIIFAVESIGHLLCRVDPGTLQPSTFFEGR